MNPLILIVEDSPEIQTYVKMILEHNKCRVITADNGKDALSKLTKANEHPDLIISDIMMPEMDGYEFFKNVSNDSRLLHIPFIFLSALDSPEDVRLGKLVGADDYLTKPINEDDLLASIAGKIMKNKKMASVNQKIQEFFNAQSSDLKTRISKVEKKIAFLVEVHWDDAFGPKLERFHPPTSDFPIKEMSVQLYEAISVIYGQSKITEAEGILTNIGNFQMTGYALFDSYSDKDFRGGQKDFMFAVLAPQISYLQSLKIKKILKEMSASFKAKKKFKFEAYWKKISDNLSEDLM